MANVMLDILDGFSLVLDFTSDFKYLTGVNEY